MTDEIIERIKKICSEQNSNATEALATIQKVISMSDRPDFSEIKDGDHFMYKGIEWIRLGKEQDGILCITADTWKKDIPFDTGKQNNWKKSSLKKVLNTEFLSLLNKEDLLTMSLDLTADNGDTSYGCDCAYVGILSCDLYRKYRKLVPLHDEWQWTCTPWCCSPYPGYASYVRSVNTSGVLGSNVAINAYGVVPACIFIE